MAGGIFFTFRLNCRYVGAENDAWIELGTETVTYEQNKADFNCFDFSALVQRMEFADAGVYAFRISEVEGSIGGVTYDDAISYFDVLVGDADMDGELEVQSVTGSSNVTVTRDEARNEYNVAVNFNNSYAPAGSAEVIIPIIKTVDDRSEQNKSPAGFVIALYNADGQQVKTSDATSAAGETSIKLVYDASSAGQTYAYVLKEVGSGETRDGMIYDETEYTIQVSVIDNLDGTVSAVTDVTELTFENVYDPQDATAELGGTKVPKGRSMREGEFSFDLYKTNGDLETDKPICTAVNNKDGSFSLEALTFDKVGTYYYVVQEDASEALGGIPYDDTKYYVTVTVTDKNGILTAECVVANVYGEAVDVEFRNTYVPMGIALPLSGEKILHGLELAEGMFQFSLYAAD